MKRKSARRGWFRWGRRDAGYRPPRVSMLQRATGWLRGQLDAIFLGSDKPPWERAAPNTVAAWMRTLTWPLWFPFYLVYAGLLALVYGLAELALRIVQPLGGLRLLHLLAGTPAIAVLAAGAWAGARIGVQSESLPETYSKLARAATKAERWNDAQLYWRRVIDLDKDPSSRFQYAEVLDKLERHEDALAIIRGLAPETRRGLPEAHWYMALRLTSILNEMDNPLQDAPELLASAKWHLDNANRQDTPQMQFAWGQYYVSTGRVDLGVEYIEKAAESWPEMHHVLAQLYTKINPEKVTTHLQRAGRHYNSVLEKEPLNHAARADLADVLIRLNQAPAAVVLLREGLQLDQNAPLKRLMSAAYVALYTQEFNRGNPDFSQLMNHLRDAFAFDPGSVLALEQVIGLAASRSPSERAQLRELLAHTNGESPAIVHFVTSVLDLLDGDKKQAIWRLEQALKIDSQLAYAKNNLAMLLIEDEPWRDLPRAEQLINEALDGAPEEPRLLDTRGQILAALGKHSDAIASFEKAVSNVQKQPVPDADYLARMNLRIADSYEALQMDDMARIHRQKAGR